MLCEKCNQEQASIHTVSIINGEKKEHHLCVNCASQTQLQYSFPSIIELLSGFSITQQQSAMPLCSCQNSWASFQKTGMLGCKECYTTYRAPLMQVIKRAQGGKTRHVGRGPKGFIPGSQQGETAQVKHEPVSEKEAQAQEIFRLREELKGAVREEKYERAAELRDRLRLLEGGNVHE